MMSREKPHFRIRKERDTGMTIRAKARLISGTEEKEFVLSENLTAEELADRFLAELGNPAPRKNYLLLVNGKQPGKDQLLQPGDVMELVMLLCGG